jgi:NitT/TauT family transport system substrate-binding protein
MQRQPGEEKPTAEHPARPAPPRRAARWLAFAPVLAAMVALMAGCGGDDDSGGGGTSSGSGAAASKPTALKVGVIPIADVAPLYLGQQKGFFKQENLTIEPQLAEGGAAIVPAVLSGSDQIGFSNTTSLIIAGSKNVPVQIIAQGVVGGESTKQAWDAVLVKKGGAIKSPKDLEGKTIAVNTLQNVGPLTINTALEKRGVDYTKVKYVEVPFPDMNAALKAGRVDAAWVVEPFVTAGKGMDQQPILYPYEETEPNLTVATYFASKKYIASNGDEVERFVRAINKSLEYAQSHPDEVRKAVLTYTKIPPPAAEAMALPQWKADLGRPTIEKTSQLAKEYGFVKEEPNLDDLIHQP